VSIVEGDPLQPAPEGLTAKTLRGAKWSYLSTFVNAGLQIGVTAILARVLAPSAFGLVAMAGVVLNFGSYFAQMGVGQAIVQRRVLTREHIAAGLWASVLIGAAFSAFVWVAAPLAAAAFNSVELSLVLRVMGLTFFVGSTSNVAGAILQREMRFRALAICDIGAYVVGYAGVGVFTALSGFGVWSLVVAAFCQRSISSICYNALARPPAAPVVSWRPYREILGFGSTVSVIGFLEFLNGNLDTMTVGRFAGSTSLGYYSRAQNLTAVPLHYMSASLVSVLLPSFSSIQADTVRLRKAYLSVITVFAGVGLPIAFGMSGAAREIIAVLLGPRWSAAVPVMQIAAVASAAALLTHFGGMALEATAHLRDKLAMNIAFLIFFSSLLVGLSRFGLVGYALAFAMSQVLQHAVYATRIGVLFHVPARDNVGAYVPGLLCGVCVWVAVYGESVLGARLTMPSGATLLVQIVTGALILGFMGLRVGHGQVFRAMHERLGTPPQSGPVAVAVRIAARMSGNKLESSPDAEYTGVPSDKSVDDS